MPLLTAFLKITVTVDASYSDDRTKSYLCLFTMYYHHTTHHTTTTSTTHNGWPPCTTTTHCWNLQLNQCCVKPEVTQLHCNLGRTMKSWNTECNKHSILILWTLSWYSYVNFCDPVAQPISGCHCPHYKMSVVRGHVWVSAQRSKNANAMLITQDKM